MFNSTSINFAGVHFGLKKMYILINRSFFWKGLYVDVANFVKQCEHCIQYSNTQAVGNGKYEQSEDIKMAESNSKNTAVRNSSKVWQKVRLRNTVSPS